MPLKTFKTYSGVLMSAACILSLVMGGARAESPVAELGDDVAPINNPTSEAVSGPQKLTPFGRIAIETTGNHYTLKVASMPDLRSASAQRKDQLFRQVAHTYGASCVESGYLKLARQRSENITCSFRQARRDARRTVAHAEPNYQNGEIGGANALSAEFVSVAVK